MNEVQVVCTVMSSSKTQDPDIAGMLAASAALALSGVPFDGPVGASRVGFTEEKGYFLNPTFEELKTSKLDMVVAGTSDAVWMVESEATGLTEDQMLGGVLFAHDALQSAVNAIAELAAEAGLPRWEWEPEAVNTDLAEALKSGFEGAVIVRSLKASRVSMVVTTRPFARLKLKLAFWQVLTVQRCSPVVKLRPS